MSQFVMPSLGADMESAVLMEWLVKEGDSVKRGQVIAEVETSKGVIEIEVFEDGVVEKLLVEPETECKVGEPMALIVSDDKEVKTEDVKEEILVESSVEPEKETEISADEHVKISPAALKKANELGIDISTITPKDGIIHLEQVESAITTDTVETKKVTKEITKEIAKEIDGVRHEIATAEINGMRHAIAAAMSRSNAEIPHYYLSTSINMTPSLNYLEGLNKERSIKDRILPAAMLIRAVVLALSEVPELNGFYKDNEHIISKEISPGFAIALRKKGLITPALLDAQNMNLEQTMDSMSDLISRTRGGKLRSSEMTRQTVTITNLGDLGVESVYGVIYPPQVAVVGLGAIKNAPWAEGDSLSVRKVMQATLAGDHRATDGRTGALFLEKLDKFLQNPKELL